MKVAGRISTDQLKDLVRLTEAAPPGATYLNGLDLPLLRDLLNTRVLCERLAAALQDAREQFDEQGYSDPPSWAEAIVAYHETQQELSDVTEITFAHWAGMCADKKAGARTDQSPGRCFGHRRKRCRKTRGDSRAWQNVQR